MHGDPAQDVFRPGFGVLHFDVEIAVLVEGTGVQQFVLELLPGTGPVHRHQVGVRKLLLRVLVQPALIAVRGHVVEVEVILLDVLTVVALGVRQAEQALFQDGVPPIPQRQGQAQPLLVVADPGQAVLAPPVGPGPRLIVAEIGPGVAIIAVVLADRAPLAFTEVGPPGPPGHTGPRLAEPGLLGRLLGCVPGQRGGPGGTSGPGSAVRSFRQPDSRSRCRCTQRCLTWPGAPAAAAPRRAVSSLPGNRCSVTGQRLPLEGPFSSRPAGIQWPDTIASSRVYPTARPTGGSGPAAPGAGVQSERYSSRSGRISWGVTLGS